MRKRINVWMIIITAVAAICISCEPEIDLVHHFVIRSGEHYASPRMTESLQRHKLAFEARFDSSAIYDFRDKALQSNKNKLMGFADCNSVHHENSARFAWQWYNNRLEIYAYCYVNGERKEAFVGTAELNRYHKFELSMEDDFYVFRLNQEAAVYIKRGNVCRSGIYYKMWPYFGGSIPAPHDVHISIKPNF